MIIPVTQFKYTWFHCAEAHLGEITTITGAILYFGGNFHRRPVAKAW